jgi:hypothetical protein
MPQGTRNGFVISREERGQKAAREAAILREVLWNAAS